MASSVSVSLGNLIDETLDVLLRPSEHPRRLALGSNALADLVDDKFTLAADSDLVNVTDVIEFDSELVLVTAKNADATPVFTCARGYLDTTAATHASGSVGRLNPQFPRSKVERVLRQGVGVLNTWLPRISSAVFQRIEDQQYVEVGSDTIEVLEVGFFNEQTGRYTELAGWRFFEDVPDTVVGSTKLVRVPSSVTDDQDLVVKRVTPYSWSGTGELASVSVPLTADDLLPLYAAARLASGREVSRLELDKVEEWNREAAIRQGVNLRQVREMWTDFYRRLDECRRIQNVPRHRPYVKMPRLRLR